MVVSHRRLTACWVYTSRAESVSLLAPRLGAGTAAVLVLDPARRSATVYRPGGDVRIHGEGDELDLSDAVPGWRVAVADFFV